MRLASGANDALDKHKKVGCGAGRNMCAYILKNDLVGSQVDGVERGADGRPTPLGGTLKRVFDVLGASIALVLLGPLMLLVAALVRLLLGGPVLFAQKRVGFDGKVFSCYRFRTMVLDAEKAQHDHLIGNPAAAIERREAGKLKNDPRVTCLGNVLQKLGIDELPQLFNVLRGDMSLVGPQPVLPDEIASDGHHARAYLRARPGLTGMWLVSGGDHLSNVGRIARDCYYARHWSLRLDIWLLFKTIFPGRYEAQ